MHIDSPWCKKEYLLGLVSSMNRVHYVAVSLDGVA